MYVYANVYTDPNMCKRFTDAAQIHECVSLSTNLYTNQQMLDLINVYTDKFADHLNSRTVAKIKRSQNQLEGHASVVTDDLCVVLCLVAKNALISQPLRINIY